MALYYQGSGIPVIQMNDFAPPPPKGTGLAQGGHLIKAKKFVAEM